MKIGKDVWKYDKIYNREGVMTKRNLGTTSYENADEEFRKKWDRYGHANEGKMYLGEILNMKPDSVLDIGCGWNKMAKQLMSGGIRKAIGLDCSCPGADVIASAHDMPFEDRTFDLIISFDCMEHIPEEEIEGTLSEFARVSYEIFIKIGLTDTTTRIDGETLHPCVKPREWWIEMVEECFYITKEKIDRPGTPWESLILKGYSK